MIKIFVVTHKPLPPISNDLYKIIQVGNNDSIYPECLRDNIGESISEKNSSFCELTASYWIWKNVKDEIYVGLCHYRRFIDIYKPKPSLNFRKKKSDTIVSIEKLKNKKIYTKSIEEQIEKIKKILDEGYIIIPSKLYFGKKIIEQYSECHNIQDIICLRNVIKNKCPEYINSFESVLERESMSIGNMFISSKKFWDEYHEWLFDILFQLEKVIKISDDPYQKRVFGFLSERLLNVYIYHHKIKVKEFDSLFIES